VKENWQIDVTAEHHAEVLVLNLRCDSERTRNSRLLLSLSPEGVLFHLGLLSRLVFSA
jgi:hypothetical protein